MGPDVDRSNRQECLETRCDAFPADDKATVFLLKPGKGPIGLEPGYHFFDGSTTVFFVFQTRFGSCARIPRFRSWCRSAFAS